MSTKKPKVFTGIKTPRLPATVLAAFMVLVGSPSSSLAAEQATQVAPTHAIAMHGTPKYGPDFAHFDYVNPLAPKGGTIRYAGFGSFDSFNGYISKGEAADGLGGVYDTLLTSSADEPFTEYGLLAQSIEIPEDRGWITFHLRPEATWHDGQPITAEDVKWTFETLIEKGAPHYKFYYKDVARVDVLDSRSIKFTFSTTENRELPLIIGQLPVLPKHYWQDKDFSKTTLEPPLGSGPYKIGKYETGRYIVFDRVDSYWGKNLPVNVGHYNFDHIRYDYFRDGNIQVEALKGGAVDFRSENISKTWATAYEIDEVKNGLLIKEEIHHDRPQGMQAFVFNTRRAKFSDPRVRRALGYAFDFEWANKNLFYGQYKRTRSYFDNSELAATGLPSEQELKLLEPLRGQIPEGVFDEEFNPPATDGDGRIRAQLREADRLLKEAGWTIQGKTRAHKDTGEQLEMEIILIQPTFERIVLPFAKNLERLGVTLNVRTIDPPQYIERLRSFDFDMIVSSWGQSLSPGNEQMNYWGSDAADTPGSRNYIGIQNPAVDTLISHIIAAPTREDLVARVRALDRVLQHGHYVIPHWHIPYDRLVYWNKFSHPDVTPTQGAQIGTWWYDEEKAAKLSQAKGN